MNCWWWERGHRVSKRPGHSLEPSFYTNVGRNTRYWKRYDSPYLDMQIFIFIFIFIFKAVTSDINPEDSRL
jgi:hypothetical protein